MNCLFKDSIYKKIHILRYPGLELQHEFAGDTIRPITRGY